MTIASLVGELGFKFDDKTLNKFEDGMKNAAKSLAVVATATAAMGAGVFAFVQNIASTNDELGKMSERLGIATADLQSWQYAAELGDGSASSMSSSLENLSKVSSEAARGMGAGVEVFGMLGISATDANGKVKDTSILMEEVADRVSNLGTQSEKLEFINKLGISSDLLLTLEQGSDAIRKQRLEAEQLGFTLSKNSTKSAADFNDELLRVNKVISGVASAIATYLMPPITMMMTAFKEWFIINKELISQNLKGFFDGIIKAFNFMINIGGRVINVVQALVGAMGGWKVALGVATAAMLYFNGMALLLPLLFIAIGAAIFLLIEDIVAYFQGGESALGDLVDGWKLVFSVGGNALEGLGILIDTWLIQPLTRVTEMIGSIFSGIGDIAGGISDSVSGAIGNVGGFLGMSSVQSPSMVQSSNTSSVSAPQTNNIEIKIEGGGGSPTQMAQSVRSEIIKTMTDINRQAGKSMASPIKG